MKNSLINNIKFLLILILLSSGFSVCHAQRTNDDAAIKEVNLFLNQYINHFNQLLNNPNDLSALQASAENISYPAVLINAKGNKLIATKPSIVKEGNLGFLNYLSKRGITQINWQVVEIKPLGKNVYIASNIANLLNKSGEKISQTSGTYLLHRQESRWKMFSRIQHPLEDRILLASASQQ
ncbi:hypothetical protein ACUR5C_01405 [Aliikangiella sp. IMCC44653]